MGEIQTYASNTGDLNFLFLLIIVGTYLLYEVGKAIVDNNDDDDMDGGMMMRIADGSQAWIGLQIYIILSTTKICRFWINILFNI